MEIRLAQVTLKPPELKPELGELTLWAIAAVEVYHRTLKSGCKIEERQLGKVERLEPCLAIDMVVARRILHLTKLRREVPDVPCTIFFIAVLQNKF